MKNALIMLVLSLSVAAGCASGAGRAEQPAGEASAAANRADTDRLWSAALAAVSVRFPVKSAQESLGTIETDYLVGPMSQTGAKVNAATSRDAAYDMLHTTRRRAVVSVSRNPAKESLTVCVYKQRLVRVGPEPAPVGKYSLDLVKGKADPSTSTRWVDEGRDAALEKQLEREIMQRRRSDGS